MILEIRLLLLIEATTVAPGGKIQADPAGYFGREVVRADQRTVVLERNPAAVEEQVGMGREQQAIRAVHALGATDALSPDKGSDSFIGIGSRQMRLREVGAQSTVRSREERGCFVERGAVGVPDLPLKISVPG